MRPTLNDVFYVRIDKNRKIPITCLIRALGVATRRRRSRSCSARIRWIMRHARAATPAKTSEEALLEIYRKPASGRAAHGGERRRAICDALFFDPRRYDVSQGRPL